MTYHPDSPPFDASEVILLLAVFESVYRSLPIRSQLEPMVEPIALKVIAAAKTGERDPGRLHNLVLRTLRRA